MHRILLPPAIILIAAAGCIAAEPSAEQRPGMQEQIKQWIQSPDELEYVGTIEFVVMLREGPGASQIPSLESLAPPRLYDNAKPEKKQAYIERTSRLSAFLAAVEFEGQTIAQTWRIHRAGANRIRGEFASAVVRPPQPPEMLPLPIVVARDGTRAWKWTGIGYGNIPTGIISSVAVDDSMICQAESELEFLFQSPRNWMSQPGGIIARRKKDIVSVEMAGNLSANGTYAPWRAELEFLSQPDGLVLKKKTILNNEHYWVCRYSDYRTVGERKIPWDSEIRFGPRSLYGNHDGEPLDRNCKVKSYQITGVHQGFGEGEIERLFMTKRETSSNASLTYEEITAPGVSPFVP